MDRDQIEARILWHYKLATEQSIRGAMSDPRHTGGQDLSGVLVAVGLLTREQAEWVRKQVYNEYRKAAAAKAEAEAEQGPSRLAGPYQTDAAAFDEIKSIIRAREPEPSEEIQNDLAEIQAMLNPGAPAAQQAPARPPAPPQAAPRQAAPGQGAPRQVAPPARPVQPAQPRAKAPSSRKVARPASGGQKAPSSKRVGGQKSGGSKRIGGQKSGGSKRVGGSKTGGSKIGGSKTGGSKVGGQKSGGSKAIGPKGKKKIDLSKVPKKRKRFGGE